MPDINEYSVSVELEYTWEEGAPPGGVHVEVRSPGEGGVDWHWYPIILDFNRHAARRFFGADGLCFSEDDRDDVIDKIARKVKSIKGLSFPRDKPKDDPGETSGEDGDGEDGEDGDDAGAAE